MKRLFAAALRCLMIYITCLPVYARAAPSTVSEAVLLMDAGTGQVLYEKNGYSQYYPASITKIMTGLIAVENCDLNSIVTVSDTATKIGNSSSLALIPGEEISLRALLYGMSVESANDAANAVGEYISGSITAFGQKMTARAKELGCLDTNFTNPSGLHDNSHYTTAYDMALIMRKCLEYDELCEIFRADKYHIDATNKQTERNINSMNWFVNGAYIYDGIVMTKIGWTDEATHTMITAVERDGMTLICVVMKSYAKETKWDDTRAICDWGFESFIPVTISGEKIALSREENIKCNEKGSLYVPRETITAEGTVILVTNESDAENIKVTYSQPNLSDDMKTATMTATISLDGKEITSVTAHGEVRERTMSFTATVRDVNLISDLVMTVIFGVLTFIAVMIIDILVNKRI